MMRDLNPDLSYLEFIPTKDEGNFLLLGFLPSFPRLHPIYCLSGLVIFQGPAMCLNFSLSTLIFAKCWRNLTHLLSPSAKPSFRDTRYPSAPPLESRFPKLWHLGSGGSSQGQLDLVPMALYCTLPLRVCYMLIFKGWVTKPHKLSGARCNNMSRCIDNRRDLNQIYLDLSFGFLDPPPYQHLA